MRQEDKIGCVEVGGKEADLIMLGRNIFSLSANQISKTYLKGKQVYSK